MKTLALLILSVLWANSALASTKSNFKEVARYNLGEDGGWDYLTAQPDAHRLYISRSDRLMIVDTEAGKLITEIKGTSGIHGIAIAPDFGQGFTSNGKASTVTPFDLKTFKTQDAIPVGGENPDAILYEPVTKKIFTFNGKSHDVSVIDPQEKKVVSHIPLPGKPESAVQDDKGLVFVDIEDKNTLAVIDASAKKVIKSFPVDPCDEPTGLAIDPKTKRLFVGCGNKMVVVLNAETGKIMSHFPAGQGIDAAGFDSKNNLAFVSAGEGKLTIIRELSADKFELVDTVSTQKGARTMAVDSETGNVFVVTSQFGPAPSPAPGQRSRPSIVPGTFVVLVFNNTSSPSH